jgi:hypothetical protein
VDYVEVSSANGNKALPLTPNHFYANMLTESAGVTTDDSKIPTDPTVAREFSLNKYGTSKRGLCH